MLKPSDALWRVEFRTDLTKASAPTLKLGYLLEAHWHDGVRWLGMLFRRKLTALELDIVAKATWPELSDLETFMSGLFENAWNASESGSDDLALGSAVIAQKYTIRSALQFASEKNIAVVNADDALGSFPILYAHLLSFRSQLTPALAAEVVPLKARRPAAVPATSDVELEHRAA